MTHATYYAANFKNWQAKQLGNKPSDALLATAHAFGRPGKQSLALAMAMRPEGVTGSQIVMVAGAPQNNHRRGLIEGGLFKREAAAPNEQGHTVYKITLTAKGTAAMKRAAEVAAKAALAGDTEVKPKAKKAKGKTKAATTRKAKPAAEVPVNEAPAAEVPQAETPVNKPVTEANVTA